MFHDVNVCIDNFIKILRKKNTLTTAY